MTNLSPTISAILVNSLQAAPLRDTYHSSKTLDTFLLEAYRIVQPLAILRAENRG